MRITSSVNDICFVYLKGKLDVSPQAFLRFDLHA